MIFVEGCIERVIEYSLSRLILNGFRSSVQISFIQTKECPVYELVVDLHLPTRIVTATSAEVYVESSEMQK